MASPIEEIKERLDIVDVLKGYIELRAAGRNFRAVCPFHAEKTPSLIVSPERQIWHCFGCGAGGDVIKFVSLFENIEFYEALRILAEKAGVDLKRYTPAEEKQFGVLYEIQRSAADFFKDKLAVSGKALKYLEKRKLKTETAEEFELGFAPENFDALTVELLERKFELADIVRSGLVFRTDSGKYMDRFRGRIMFPIHNHFGKIVGFTGRILPELEREDVGKYVNSPETPIFQKSKLLYGLWRGKKEIRDSGFAVLLEGQMDFLMCYQDGIRNAVATSGTALTSEHLRTLRKITDRLVVGFDSDSAGKLAAEKACDLAAANDFTALVANWGEYKDAAEAVSENPGSVAGMIGEAKPAMNFIFDRYLTDGGSSKTGMRFILERIRRIWSPIERSAWLRELAYRTGIGEKSLTEEMEKVAVGARDEEVISETRVPGTVPEYKPETRIEMIALRLLGLANERRELMGRIESYERYLPAVYGIVYKSVLDNSQESLPLEARGVFNIISLRGGLESELLEDEEHIDKEFRTLLKELEIEFLSAEKNGLAREIASLEEGGEEEKLALALQKFDEISKKIQDIKHAKETAG